VVLFLVAVPDVAVACVCPKEIAVVIINTHEIAKNFICSPLLRKGDDINLVTKQINLLLWDYWICLISVLTFDATFSGSGA
jgi:hypothetical protein